MERRRAFVSVMLLLFAVAAFSQSEVLRDSVKHLPVITPAQGESQQMDNSNFALPDATLPHSPASQTTTDSITLRITLPETTKTPWPTPRLGENHNPWARDYNQYDQFILTPNSRISTYSTYNTYPTMGTYIIAGAAYTYQFNKHWDVTGGIYAAQYTMPSFIHGSRFDAGINGSLGYRFNDRLKIRVIGQYSLNGQRNAASGYLTPMAPQSYYGAIMELKVTDWLELHGGMERVYDSMKNKWSTVPILYPVIKIK